MQPNTEQEEDNFSNNAAYWQKQDEQEATLLLWSYDMKQLQISTLSEQGS